MCRERKNCFGLSLFVIFFVFVLSSFTNEMSSLVLAKEYEACSKIAQAAYKAGLKEAEDDYWIAIGNCYNLPTKEERKECMREAKEEWKEAKADTKDQREARLEICEELGEAPYDPVIDPNDFVDFDAVIEEEEILTPNPYFPLIPGTTWEYLALDADEEVIERILVEVLEETTEILGVPCIVVRDRVWELDEEEEEVLVEDTDDWYAQDLVGNVWYFGELSQEFEDGELISLEGSWKAGRDGAKPGILMLADSQPDDIYRQEFLLGEAEDIAKVISIGMEVVNVPFGDYMQDVLKTQEWTPIEPDGLEFKFYAPNTGLILEMNPDTNERVELIDMTTPE
jgi:hypothetical protein